jgi:hypothetical protein
MEQVRAVPLTGVDPKSIREETRQDLDLAAVYTALMTQRPEATPERERLQDRTQRHLSVLAVLNAEPHLALLGDPGSGKSTFVHFIALCMAGELLGHPDANVATLRAPVPDEDETARRDPGRTATAAVGPWPLLPMHRGAARLCRRGLAASTATSAVNSDTCGFMVSDCLKRCGYC